MEIDNGTILLAFSVSFGLIGLAAGLVIGLLVGAYIG